MSTPAILYDFPSKETGGAEEKHDGETKFSRTPTELDLDQDNEDNYETVFADVSTEYVMVPATISNFDFYTAESVMEQTTKEDNKTMFQVLSGWLKPWKLLSSSSSSSKEASTQTQDEPVIAATTSNATPIISTNNIYSSYDWVSELVVDEQGSRLILPGQLVVLDPDDSDISLPGDDTPTPNQHTSIFASSTIMVSAHDLLATQSNESTTTTIMEDAVLAEALPGSFQHTTNTRMVPTPIVSAPLTTTATIKTISKSLWRRAKRKVQLSFSNSSNNKKDYSRSTALAKAFISKTVVHYLERKLYILSMAESVFDMTLDWCLPLSSRITDKDDEDGYEIIESVGSITTNQEEENNSGINIELATTQTKMTTATNEGGSSMSL